MDTTDNINIGGVDNPLPYIPQDNDSNACKPLTPTEKWANMVVSGTIFFLGIILFIVYLTWMLTL